MMKQISEYIDYLLEKLEINDEVLGILLYGSYALEQEDEFSDIDILIVVEEINKNICGRGNLLKDGISIEYFIKTDYGVGTIPDKNSARKIKYNPENPSDAVFLESDKNSVFILLGLIFILFSMPFVFKTLNKNVFFRKLKNDILGLYMGVVFFALGIGVINFLLSQASSFIEVIKNWGFWIVIPIVFIVAGFLQIIKCLFMIIKKNKK